MSTEALSAFFAKVEKDEDLRKKIDAIETADKESAVADLVKLGTDTGFEFTVDCFASPRTGVFLG